MLTASAIFPSANSSNVGQKFKYIVGVRLCTATYTDLKDTVLEYE